MSFEIDKPFELVNQIDYLDKSTLIPQEVEILRLIKSRNHNRPLFVCKFKDGEKAFDLARPEMEKIMYCYGRVPRAWIGQKIHIKAVPYAKGSGLSYSLSVDPL